jgi:hypothetical protein
MQVPSYLYLVVIFCTFTLKYLKVLYTVNSKINQLTEKTVVVSMDMDRAVLPQSHGGITLYVEGNAANCAVA